MNRDYEATIIVLNRNGEAIIEKCLHAIISQSVKNLEIIVVDNNSTDRSLDTIRTFSSIKLIVNSTNLGFTGGNWIGIRNASSEYIAFINNDTILDSNWVEYALHLINSDVYIGAVGGKVLKPDGSIDSIGSLISYPSGRAKFNRGYESGSIEDVVALPGSAFMVRKTAAMKVGFLDWDYFVLYEETDFFWRLRLAGYRCLYSPRILSWHLHSYTFTRDSWTYFKRYYFYIRNMMWSNLKNLERRYLIPYIVYESAFSVKQIVKLLVRRKDGKEKEYIKAYFTAIAVTFFSIKKLYEKRKFVQSIRKVPDAILLRQHFQDRDTLSKLTLRLMRL